MFNIQNRTFANCVKHVDTVLLIKKNTKDGEINNSNSCYFSKSLFICNISFCIKWTFNVFLKYNVALKEHCK